MSSLQIGKAIYTILSDNNIKKVYPLIADQGTTYPFIVYKRRSLEAADTKDRFNYQEIAVVDIIIAAEKYDESIELAEKVKNILEHKRGTYNNISIDDIFLIDADEDFLEPNIFIQKITIKILIK